MFGHDDTHGLVGIALDQVVAALSKELAPDYAVTLDEHDTVDVQGMAVLAGLKIERLNGEMGDDEVVKAAVDKVMATFTDTPWHVHIGEHAEIEDDLLSPFTNIVEGDNDPETDAFLELLFESRVLGINVVSKVFKDFVDMLQEAGVDKDTADSLAAAAAQMYGEGADLHAYLTMLMSDWDAKHPDGPSSIVLVTRANNRLNEGPVTEEQQDLLRERAEYLYRAKHGWRYHQIGLMELDRGLFDEIWEEGR